MDPQVIKDVATLRNIQATWTDTHAVQTGKQRLASLFASKEQTQNKGDFTFIVNDKLCYTSLQDFRSAEAKNTYRQLMQKQNDLDQLTQNLQQKRSQYISENGLGKKKLEPSILDLEKRIPQLQEEVEKLTNEVRRLELQKHRK